MNIISYIFLAGIAVAFIAAARYHFSSKRKEHSCCGGSCSGACNCSSCKGCQLSSRR